MGLFTVIGLISYICLFYSIYMIFLLIFNGHPIQYLSSNENYFSIYSFFWYFIYTFIYSYIYSLIYHLSNQLFVNLFIHLYIHISIYLFVHLSIHLFIHLYFRLSLHLFIHLSTDLYMPIYLRVNFLNLICIQPKNWSNLKVDLARSRVKKNSKTLKKIVRIQKEKIKNINDYFQWNSVFLWSACLASVPTLRKPFSLIMISQLKLKLKQLKNFDESSKNSREKIKKFFLNWNSVF